MARRYLRAMAVLISLSGLPGVGKTTIARALCPMIGAVHLRVDSIETSLRCGPLKATAIDGAGYMIAAEVAKDNLRLGLDVVADTVNPIDLSRQMWREASTEVGAHLLDVEIVCSEVREHQRRVETRVADIEGHALPVWDDVMQREFHAWPKGSTLRLDSARATAAENAEVVARHLVDLRAARN